MAWAAKYKDAGLVVIGVHAPEFGFEKELMSVKDAVADLFGTSGNVPKRRRRCPWPHASSTKGCQVGLSSEADCQSAAD
jgi:hypothetical protein